MPRCLIIGSGRVAGGFLAPLLHDAGWECVLACRSPHVMRAISDHGGVAVRTVPGRERWIAGIDAVPMEPRFVAAEMDRADLLATAIGASALYEVGGWLGPLLLRRLERTGRPINVIAFENHRRAAEMLARGLMRGAPGLARVVARRLGVGGAALWRTVAGRRATPAGLRFDTDGIDECHYDASSLVQGVPPLDGSLPALAATRAFEARILEKLWLFNAGHAAAAYLGWHAGATTVSDAMALPGIRRLVDRLLAETEIACADQIARSCAAATPVPRRREAILARYADPALRDPVARVAREPRRKLAAGDRLIGPAIALLATGDRPETLARVAAAALNYHNRDDPQARGLQHELELLGPEETLAAVSTLDPRDELTRMIAAHVGAHRRVEVAA